MVMQKGKKRRAMKKRNVVGMVFSLVILSVIGYAIYNSQTILLDLKAMTHVGPAKPITYFKSTPLKKEEIGKTHVFCAAELVIEVANQKIVARDTQGNKKWEKPFYGQNPYIKAIGRKIFLTDLDIGDAYILNQSGEIVAKKLGIGTIEEIKINNGTIAIWVSDDQKIKLFDESLKQNAEVLIDLSEITNWEIDVVRKMMMVSRLDTDENGLISHVQFYDFSGKLIQALSIPKEVVYHLAVHENELIILTDIGLSAYKIDDGKKVRQEIFSRPVGRFISNSKRMIINTSGGESDSSNATFVNSLIAINLEGNKEFEVGSLDLIPSRIIDTNKFVLVTGFKKLYVFNNKGTLTSLVNLQNEIVNMHAIDESTLLLIYQDHYEILRMTGL